MSLPLYHDHHAPENFNLLRQLANTGLWFDRFFNRYQSDWTLKDDDKSQWLNSLHGKAGQNEQLDDYCQRQTRLVEQLNGQSHAYKSDWHWVSGMGNPHPVENGLHWHPTLAVPYLSGASVKGMLRAWVEMNDDGLEQTALENRLKRWFGSLSKKDVAEQTGGFIFFDAIPNEAVHLITDIMTPHMGKWYSEGDSTTLDKPDSLPADWHEPVPIPFLAVKKPTLIFSIAPRRKELAEELADVFTALKNALNYLGSGAKTATGYGYFTEDPDFAKTLEKQHQQAEQKRQQAQQLQQQLAGKSELAQTFLRKIHEENWRQDKNRFLQPGVIEPWLEQLQQTADEAIINALVELFDKHIPGLLDDPDKTTGKKANPKFKERPRKLAKQLNDIRKK